MCLSAPARGQRSAGPITDTPAAAGDTPAFCSVAITQATGSTVSVRFAGMPGNQAAAGRNFVALWRNSVVPWTVEPVGRTDVLENGEEGSIVLLDVAITTVAYTVGYGVGPRGADVCASAALMPDGSPGPTDAVRMRITQLGSNSVGIHYHTLSGYRPAAAANWIGLWRGSASPYDPPPAVARVAIRRDVTDDDVRIDGIVLRAGSPYTLVYFMGPATTTAAVVLRFVTPGPP